ncbi:DUF1131 domain-containing protein [Caulobacter sp. LARHSG274]
MFRRFLLAAPLLALAACGPADKPGSTKPAAAAPAPALVTRRTADGKIDRFTPYVGGPLMLDEFSVGPLMAQTEFSMEAVKPRFPEARVEEIYGGQGRGSTLIGIHVDDGHGGVVTIYSNPGTRTVGDISISGGSPKGPRGETLGLNWGDADMDYKRCRIDQGPDGRIVICTQPGEPVLRYMFDVLGWTQDTMPSEAILRDKAILRGFLWRGGAPAQ